MQKKRKSAKRVGKTMPSAISSRHTSIHARACGMSMSLASAKIIENVIDVASTASSRPA